MSNSPKKLVVIDDDDLITELVIEAAQQVGFLGESANDFETFKEIMGRIQPDLILIDLVMPQVDGIQVLRHLASQNCTSNILLMSGFDPKFLLVLLSVGGILGVAGALLAARQRLADLEIA